MLFPAFRAELLKLRRSLVLLLCAAAPTMVIALGAVILARSPQPLPWPVFYTNIAALWSFFMLPMTATALTVLVAQFEHGPKFWNHLLALPMARWRIYGAKAAIVALLIAATSFSLLLLAPAAGAAAERIAPGLQLTGTFDAAASAWLLLRMFAGSLLLIAIQLWLALHFRSFVPPLVVGIGGTFAAVVASGAQLGGYFPWIMPTNALSQDPERAALAIGIGFWGGLVMLAIMLAALSRREAL